MKNFIRPEDVHSPKQHWNLIAVLDDGIGNGAHNNCALAIGRWDKQPVLAIRWNGNDDNPIGNPQSRGFPTWFIVPEKYREALLQQGGLAPDKLTLARSFFPA